MDLSNVSEDMLFDNPNSPFLMDQLVDYFLEQNLYPKNRWLCKKCGAFLVELKSKEQMLNIINDFIENKYYNCKKCRAKNYFVFPEKEICFLTKD